MLTYEHRIRALEEDAVQSPRKEYKACVHLGAADLQFLPGCGQNCGQNLHSETQLPWGHRKRPGV